MTEKELLGKHIERTRNLLESRLETLNSDDVNKFSRLHAFLTALMTDIKAEDDLADKTWEYVNLAKKIDPDALKERPVEKEEKEEYDFELGRLYKIEHNHSIDCAYFTQLDEGPPKTITMPFSALRSRFGFVSGFTYRDYIIRGKRRVVTFRSMDSKVWVFQGMTDCEAT